MDEYLPQVILMAITAYTVESFMIFWNHLQIEGKGSVLNSRGFYNIVFPRE